MRIVKYLINKDPYYILTNLIDKDKYSYQYLQQAYKGRWTVVWRFKPTRFARKEIDFNYAKVKTLYLTKLDAESDPTKTYLNLVSNTVVTLVRSERPGLEDNINSKKTLNIKQNIAMHNFILLIEGYIETIINDSLKIDKNKNKINKKNSLRLFCSVKSRFYKLKTL